MDFNNLDEMLEYLKTDDIYISKDNTDKTIELLREGEIKGLIREHSRYSYRITTAGLDYLLDFRKKDAMSRMSIPRRIWENITQYARSEKGSIISWILKNIWAVIFGLLLAYLVFRLKWN